MDGLAPGESAIMDKGIIAAPCDKNEVGMFSSYQENERRSGPPGEAYAPPRR